MAVEMGGFIDWLRDEHKNFGGSSFIEISIAFNLAGNAIARVRDWFSDLSEHLMTKMVAWGADQLDSAGSASSTGFAARYSKEGTLVKSKIENFSRRWFRIATVAAWIAIAVGAGALYLNLSHCALLLMALIWPSYVALVLLVTFGKCAPVFGKMAILGAVVRYVSPMQPEPVDLGQVAQSVRQAAASSPSVGPASGLVAPPRTNQVELVKAPKKRRKNQS